jgi:outer membrane protein TolC
MNNGKTMTIYNLLAVILLVAPTSYGQDNPQSASSNGRNPQSDVRVGVNPAKRVTLTLKDAMSMALENNRDIEVERLNVQMNEFDVRAAQGFYDPSLATTLYYDRNLIPATSIFASG